MSERGVGELCVEVLRLVGMTVRSQVVNLLCESSHKSSRNHLENRLLSRFATTLRRRSFQRRCSSCVYYNKVVQSERMSKDEDKSICFSKSHTVYHPSDFTCWGRVGSTNADPQSGVFAHTKSVWCNMGGGLHILNDPYHKYRHAAMIRAWGSVLLAPHYPEGCLEHQVAHCRQSQPTWSTLRCDKVDPSVLGALVTITPPLPGIPYNAITTGYHINFTHEWQDLACKISKQILHTDLGASTPSPRV